jgi:hypothetical protein
VASAWLWGAGFLAWMEVKFRRDRAGEGPGVQGGRGREGLRQGWVVEVTGWAAGQDSGVWGGVTWAGLAGGEARTRGAGRGDLRGAG